MQKTPAKAGFFMPAEWESHEGTWISWPKNPQTFPEGVLRKVEEAYCEIVSALSENEKVFILVDGLREKEHAEKMISKSGANFANIEFKQIRSADVWVRDYGPTFLLSDDKSNLGAVKWEFNAWGGKYDDLLLDSKTGEEIAKESGAEVFYPKVVMEGGSIEVDGAGVVITTRQCLLNKNRNPKLSQKEIEKVLMENLGCSRVVWLNEGIEGDDTDGHIDDFCRFAKEGVVLFADADEGENCRRMRENRKLLSLQGWEILSLPMPRKLFAGGQVLPASYANFYIGNKAVLFPSFGDPNDKKAQEVLESCFSKREVVPIYSRFLVFGLGAIHCITQQQPKAQG